MIVIFLRPHLDERQKSLNFHQFRNLRRVSHPILNYHKVLYHHQKEPPLQQSQKRLHILIRITYHFHQNILGPPSQRYRKGDRTHIHHQIPPRILHHHLHLHSLKHLLINTKDRHQERFETPSTPIVTWLA